MKRLMSIALGGLLSCFLAGQSARAMQQQVYQKKSYNLVDLCAPGISYSKVPGQKLKFRCYTKKDGSPERFCECRLRERDTFVGRASLEKLLAARSVSEIKPGSKPVNLPETNPESQPVDEPVRPSIGQRLLPWVKALWPGFILALPPVLHVIKSSLADKNFFEEQVSFSSPLPERLARGDIFLLFVLYRFFALTFDFLSLLPSCKETVGWWRGNRLVLWDDSPDYPEFCQCKSDPVCSKLKQLGYQEADLVKVKYIPPDNPDAGKWANNAFTSNRFDTYPMIVLGPFSGKASWDRMVLIMFHEVGHLWHQTVKRQAFFKPLALVSDLLVRGLFMWFGISISIPQKLQWLKAYLAIAGVHYPENNFEALCLVGGSIMRCVLELCKPKTKCFTPIAMIASNAHSRYHERLADSFAAQHAPLLAQGLLASAQRYEELAASDSLENGKRAWYGRAWHWFSYYLFEDHPTHSSRAEFFRKAYIKRLWLERREQVIPLQTDRDRLLQKAFAVGKNNKI